MALTTSLVETPIRLRYTFRRIAPGPAGVLQTQYKRVSFYTKGSQDHEAQARARLPFSWYKVPVQDVEMLRA